MAMIRFAGFDHDAPDIVLRRVGVARYKLEEQFRYQDPEFGTITIPADVDSFETDFGSVPWFATFITPADGPHLPAVLLHDALIGDPDHPTYTTRDRVTIGRDAADRIFNDAMRDVGTPTIQRLVIWSAASLGSARERSMTRFALWVLAVVGLAVASTLDIIDVFNVLPWLNDWSFIAEWAVAAAVVASSLTIIGPAVLGYRYAKAAAVQAVIVGLVFLPVLAMIPARLALVAIPRRLASTRRD